MLIQKAKTWLKLQSEDDFNVASAEAVVEKLLEALAKSGKKQVILILGETDRLDVAGLKLLIGLVQECVRKGLTLSLQTQNAAILETIRLFELDALIEIQGV